MRVYNTQNYWCSGHCPSLALSKGLNRAGISLPSSRDGNRSNFLNVVFSSIENFERWTKSRNPVILSALFDYARINLRGVCKRFSWMK
jgi:hypothetical protein